MEQELKQVQESMSRRVSEGKRMLACPLSDGELIARGEELAKSTQALAAEVEAQVEERKEMRERVDEMAQGIRRLARVMLSREELREVLVVSDLVDTAEGPMVRETRSDTGEWLWLRKPTAQELQPGMGI